MNTHRLLNDLSRNLARAIRERDIAHANLVAYNNASLQPELPLDLDHPTADDFWAEYECSRANMRDYSLAWRDTRDLLLSPLATT